MESVDVLARAKINLYLRIESRRPDGYHDLATVFHAIDAGDRLIVTRASRPRGAPPALLHIEPGPFAAATPAGPGNLVLRADALLRARHELPPLDYRLDKRIPLGSGLGGGSADAAAALVAANALGQLALADGELHALAAELGSDTAFCLRGGCAVGRGRGDLLQPVASCLHAHVVVAWPGWPSSTAEAYRTSQPEGPDAAALATMVGAVERGDFTEVARGMSNSFYNRRLPGYEQAVRFVSAFRAAGAETILMSGSGSSLFALFEHAAVAEACLEAMRTRAAWTLSTRLAHCGVA